MLSPIIVNNPFFKNISLKGMEIKDLGPSEG